MEDLIEIMGAVDEGLVVEVDEVWLLLTGNGIKTVNKSIPGDDFNLQCSQLVGLLDEA